MDTVEQEIALALTSPGTTSAELAQLIEQATAAAAAADEEAEKKRGNALDPTVLVDIQAVSAAVVAAELKRDRLQAAVVTLARQLIHLQKTVVRPFLHLNEVGNLQGCRDL